MLLYKLSSNTLTFLKLCFVLVCDHNSESDTAQTNNIYTIYSSENHVRRNETSYDRKERTKKVVQTTITHSRVRTAAAKASL